MPLRAKFVATAVHQHPTAVTTFAPEPPTDGEVEQSAGAQERFAQVTLTAVWSNTPENESWSKATPSGQLQMIITNPDALTAFVEGKEYFLDFTPAD